MVWPPPAVSSETSAIWLPKEEPLWSFRLHLGNRRQSVRGEHRALARATIPR